MRRARQYTTDFRGLSICTYNGRHRFAWARFSSEALALQWFCRMRCGVAIARVPMYLGHLSPRARYIENMEMLLSARSVEVVA
jgi:hypothetical protein